MRRIFLFKLTTCLAAGLFLCAAPAAFAQAAGVNCKQVLNRMFSAINNVKTLRYNLYANERVNGKYNAANSEVKVNVSPFKAYYKYLKKGIEVLYVEGQEENEAIVNPNGFPYFNLHLDPEGKLMRKGQHQTIKRLGFSYTGTILQHAINQFPDAYSKDITYRGDTVCNGYPCYNIELNVPDFHYYTYMVEDTNETVSSIASNLYLCDYLVLSANKFSSYEDALKKGQIITIPNAYAKRTLMSISKNTYLPVYVKVYDDKGLLEEYSFSNIQVNCTIQDAEFTENYTGYHF